MKHKRNDEMRDEMEAAATTQGGWHKTPFLFGALAESFHHLSSVFAFMDQLTFWLSPKTFSQK